MKVAKQRNVILLEDARSKSKRLKEEGSILADSERYWEALKKWDEALQLTPNNETILDMKAQALLILHEVFPAVQAAELAVKSNAKWWPAHQTLGRAQLGLGEIKLAITSFSKAIHLNPTDFELWEEDLKWACFLLKQKHEMNSEKSIGKELVKDSTSEELLERRPCKDDLHVSWSQERVFVSKNDPSGSIVGVQGIVYHSGLHALNCAKRHRAVNGRSLSCSRAR
ncbi:tetratricopeptide repeat protein 33-like isoform X3 [Acanthaster planci]|nr:tetratricopeptide repeat protein 33-like isoform X3 [Acanthaster planci]XP_022087819.1 tetratricopeptide repeat protein 33-like isoform X3 [Acanthaster planci]XP_022087820.1 tetratricopeptide repeat protein 33-like isoform X3 [Acanthaster planci]XP_022087821.1 tetratricopeptide repeat protein 33-like isoform X3 [Acanthaster planci]XP_022087822.1 tetratricopeptide repeat protein 33-like isoform X3 [Acanthaster planci]